MDSLGGEKKIGSLEKKYGIVEKSLLEYVSYKKTFRTERILKDVSELYF